MKSIIKSLLVVVAVAAIAGGATYSYFSSTATSTANTFSAGTLDLQISNDNSAWAKGVSGTWVSPEGWAPGQSVTGTVYMTNTGTVDSNHVYFGFNSPTHSGGIGSVDLMDKIIVTNLQETFKNTTNSTSVTTQDQTSTLANQIHSGNSVLTLKDLINVNLYSFDDQSNDGVILKSGNNKDYSITFTFKFNDNNGLEDSNAYQGATAGFILNMNATQNSPTDGMFRI